VKEVGFKAGMKERGGYRCTEWSLMLSNISSQKVTCISKDIRSQKLCSTYAHMAIFFVRSK